jgi:hypothetical protein
MFLKIILLWICSWLLNLLLVKDNNTSKTIETLEVINVYLNIQQYLAHSMFDLNITFIPFINFIKQIVQNDWLFNVYHQGQLLWLTN